ncbi:MAG TPA: hypothetical protein VNF45_04230 [Candidatus Binataceae bacterium]|nr:hypothetical protein [Candidatus Binataceae bacterium]
MPAREISLIGLDRDFRNAAEINRDNGGDIGDRKLVTRYKAMRAEFPIEPGETVLGVEALHFSVLGQLADAPFKEIVALAKSVGDRLQNVEFHPAIPHLDHRALFCAGAEERRLRMEFLEVAADGHALGDAGAVVEFEDGHGAKRIFPAKVVAAIYRLDDIDFLVRNLNTLFGKEYSDTARIRGIMALIKFHYSLLKFVLVKSTTLELFCAKHIGPGLRVGR